MSTYKEIKGTTVQDLDSDPTNQLGDIFYNSTSNTLKAFNLGSENIQNIMQTTKYIVAQLNSASRIIKRTSEVNTEVQIELDLIKSKTVLGFVPEEFNKELKTACHDVC